MKISSPNREVFSNVHSGLCANEDLLTVVSAADYVDDEVIMKTMAIILVMIMIVLIDMWLKLVWM